MRVRRTIGIALLLLLPQSAWSANSVTVESKQMGSGAVDCPIYIQLSNDVALSGFELPLEARSVTPGAFMTGVKLTWRERLHIPGILEMIRINARYPDANGTCRPGSFAPPYASNDTLKHAVIDAPEGFMFAALSDDPSRDLPPGHDIVGSLALCVDLGPTAGTFQIDTTCIDPGNHIDFVDAGALEIVPAFEMGTIAIVPNAPPVAVCQNLTVPAGPGCVADASVDNGSYDPDGGSVSIVQTPPGPYPIGVTSVQLIVTDQSCTADTCLATVTVQDLTPPVIVCPADTAILIPYGSAGTIVNFMSSATDNCPGVNHTSTPAPGSFFPVGLTTVTSIATDASGNADTCRFQVLLSPDLACNDHPNDINCDGHIDIIDVVLSIEVAFRGRDPGSPCCFSPSTGARIERNESPR
jgi:hypothetical protein